jgi:MFS family permease
LHNALFNAASNLLNFIGMISHFSWHGLKFLWNFRLHNADRKIVQATYIAFIFSLSFKVYFSALNINLVLGLDFLTVLRSPSFEAELVGYRPCDAWEYDRTKFTSTISSEFNLVCEDDYLLSINQTIYFSGMLVGVTVAGMLSDRFGRKSILIAVVLLLSVSGIMTGIAPDFHTFLVARMFSALGCVGQ